MRQLAWKQGPWWPVLNIVCPGAGWPLLLAQHRPVWLPLTEATCLTAQVRTSGAWETGGSWPACSLLAGTATALSRWARACCVTSRASPAGGLSADVRALLPAPARSGLVSHHLRNSLICFSSRWQAILYPHTASERQTLESKFSLHVHAGAHNMKERQEDAKAVSIVATPAGD